LGLILSHRILFFNQITRVIYTYGAKQLINRQLNILRTFEGNKALCHVPEVISYYCWICCQSVHHQKT